MHGIYLVNNYNILANSMHFFIVLYVIVVRHFKFLSIAIVDFINSMYLFRRTEDFRGSHPEYFLYSNQHNESA